MRSAVRHAFIKYHEANNRTFPEHVIIFRDGVGDGQVTTSFSFSKKLSLEIDFRVYYSILMLLISNC